MTCNIECGWCNKKFRTYKARNRHNCLIGPEMTEQQVMFHSSRLLDELVGGPIK